MTWARGRDDARKASAALLAVQGLRATTRGGHIAVIDAVRAQFNDKGGLPVFGQLNRLRRRLEPPPKTCPLTHPHRGRHPMPP